MSEKQYRVRTPLFPKYSNFIHLMQILDGEKARQLSQMMSDIKAQTGTPQDPVDWSDPDVWIDKRLKDDSKKLAKKIWEESKHAVNPRHVYGSYLFNRRHQFLEDKNGKWDLTPRGKAFIKGDLSVLHEVDFIEGIDYLLKIINKYTNGKPADLIPEWSAYLKEYSKFGTDKTIKDTMRRRLTNILDRELVTNINGRYELTEEGKKYLHSFTFEHLDPTVEIVSSITEHNRIESTKLKDFLHQMDPYQFEHVIKELLESIGYEDVEVTKASGDKGIDVVANVQVGITEIREVVQVKRLTSNVTRPVIDQLRGALPYHKAIRGTIITLSDFSKGCSEAAFFQGAAPITLINGSKLIELLTEHNIGIKRKAVELIEFDGTAFGSDESEMPEDAEEI